MAVASDLPSLTAAQQLRHARNSILYDSRGNKLGILTSNENRILVPLPGHRPVDALRRHRDRGQALLQQLGRRPARHRARVRAGHRPEALRAGRLDDRPAVRQERAAGPGQPHRLREAARGGARLPPHEEVVQGGHPHQLPQHDLLRQRRLRRRVGGADVLRQGPQPHRLRRAASTARAPRSCSRGSPRCSPASSPRRAPTTRSRTRSPRSSGATSCCANMLQQGRLTRSEYDDALQQPLWSGELDPPRVRTLRAVLHHLGAPAADRPLRPREGVRGRAEDQDDARPRPAEGRRRPRSTRYLSYPGGPTASLVAIDNKTGEVRAMVGGRDYATVAVQPRDPGPAPAGLVVQAVHPRRRRCKRGRERQSTCGRRASSDFIVPGTKGKEHFVVNNFEGTYAGIAIARAGADATPTTRSTRPPASTTAPRRSRSWRGAWASARRSRTTSR